ncbi:tetratricopeptide repeat protein [Pseudomonas cichorii]|nr:tetratricopeptide repeat protein [Pseudomonas cichorii]MBX8538466.1 tetratricopeptide repeat protein [Pseudomonas cichorii]MBX8549324.1 tetratricopeptide repeat protein [Pseudomonas cichorii]MBX8578361.1 tetratricopeptide repeat protein [Pseudomonas cichorii]MBX8584304.1 tetratricopeptide repeat protein [Pseudomonas cichorii]
MQRDDFKKSIKAALRERVAHRCSNPECRVPTAAPGSGDTEVIRGGDAAHITAASPKGPRYDESISAAKRSSIENGIWLCVVCARKIDHNSDAYPVELLRQWKVAAETTASLEFGKPLFSDTHLHTKMHTLIAQQDQTHREILAQLSFIQADLVKERISNQIGAEPLDHLLDALKRLVESGKARGAIAMQLSRDGRYEDAAAEAIRLAEDETKNALHLGSAAKESSASAAMRWLDAGDVAVLSDHLKAANAYECCTDIDPKNIYGWSRLGEVSWWIGRLDKGLHAFTRMWYLMPDGVVTLLRAEDSPDVQWARFTADNPGVTRDSYIWMIRGVIIAGLNIIEILRREPSLVSKWVIRLLPVDREAKQREPTEVEAPGIVEFFSERVYSLGRVINASAALVEHRRILEGLACVASSRGELEESENYLQRAHIMSIEQKDFVAEAVYLCNLGTVASMQGQANTARDYFAQALAFCKGDPSQGRLFVGTKLVSIEEAARRNEQHKERLASGIVADFPAVDEIEVSNLLADEFDRDTEVAMRSALILKEVEGNAYGNLGVLAMVEGDFDLALREFERSLKLHELIGYTKGVNATRDAILRLKQTKADVMG